MTRIWKTHPSEEGEHTRETDPHHAVGRCQRGAVQGHQFCADAVTVAHCETATGVLAPLHELASVVREESEETKRGIVFEQDPQPGERIERGNFVTIGRPSFEAMTAFGPLLTTVAELRATIERQQAHIDRLVRMTFGRRSERVTGPTLFDDVPDAEPNIPAADLQAIRRDVEQWDPRRSGAP